MCRGFTTVTWWIVNKVMIKWDEQLRLVYAGKTIAPLTPWYYFLRGVNFKEIVYFNNSCYWTFLIIFFFFLLFIQVNIICGNCLNGQCTGLWTFHFQVLVWLFILGVDMASFQYMENCNLANCWTLFLVESIIDNTREVHRYP